MERGFAMRPRERRETSEQELFRSRLDQIIDIHAFGEAGAGDRLAFSGGEVRGGVHRQAGPAAIADAADGWGERSSNTLTTFPTRRCAIAGWRTRTSSTSAARIFF